jgi:predicted dehydrogenase
MSAPLGVALVGVGPEQWSGVAHIPAICAHPGLELRRLVTSSDESARRAESGWSVPASATLEDVLEDPTVGLVTITVRVAKHAAIAAAAIKAGKHVYCEWPLAVSVDEARLLARLSSNQPDQLHVVGLQGRFAAEVQHARRLVRDGYLGRPLAVHVQVAIPQALLARPQHRAHLRHRSAAANVLTIQGGHVLDMVVCLLGADHRAATVSYARIWTAVDEFVVAGTGERLSRDAPDNVVAVLDVAGVPVTLLLSQTSARPSARIEVQGTEGSLLLEGEEQPQMSPLTLSRTALHGHPESVTVVSSGDGRLDRQHPGANVARLYERLAAAAAGEGPHDLPGYDRAVALHELLAAIEQAAGFGPVSG